MNHTASTHRWARCVSETEVDLLSGLLLSESERAEEQYVYASEMKLLGAVSAPVSYTHLDVYKRQGIYSTSCTFCLIFLLSIRLSRNASRMGIGKPHSRP